MCFRRWHHIVNQNAAGRRLQKAVRQLDERRFAASVRAKQTDDLSRLNGNVGVIQRQHTAVVFCQALTL